MKKRGILAILFAGVMSVFAFKVVRNKRKKKKSTKEYDFFQTDIRNESRSIIFKRPYVCELYRFVRFIDVWPFYFLCYYNDLRYISDFGIYPM